MLDKLFDAVCFFSKLNFCIVSNSLIATSAMFIIRLESATSAVTNSAALNSASLWIVTGMCNKYALVFILVFLLFANDYIWSYMLLIFLYCHASVVTGTSLVVSYGQNLNEILPTYTNMSPLILTSAVTLTAGKISNTLLSHPFELIYLGAVTTALANYIQTMAQKTISPERASVIYALDPVYGAFFSYLLLGDTFTVSGWIGAGLITIAAATNAYLDFGKGSSPKSESKEQ